MKFRPVKMKEKKSPALRIPDNLDMSLTAGKHVQGNQSLENQALENEEHSTKHPKGRNRTKHPKSKTKPNPNSKTKYEKLENEASKVENEAALTIDKDQICYC